MKEHIAFISVMIVMFCFMATLLLMMLPGEFTSINGRILNVESSGDDFQVTFSDGHDLLISHYAMSLMNGYEGNMSVTFTRTFIHFYDAWDTTEYRIVKLDSWVKP